MTPESKHPFAKRRVDFGRIRDKILVCLYVAYMDDAIDFMSLSRVAQQLSGEPVNAIREEMKVLVEDLLVIQKYEQRVDTSLSVLVSGRGATVDRPVDAFKLTRSGIEAVNKMPDERVEIISSELVFPQPKPPAVLEDQWTPLTLENDSKELSAAVEATESAISALEASNGYSSQHPDERDAILSGLKGNLEALRKRLISKGQVIEGLVKPLRYIAKQFANAAIGDLAKRAVNFLIMLIGGGN